MLKSLNKIITLYFLILGSSELYGQLSLGGAFTLENETMLSMASASSNSGNFTLAFRQTNDVILGQDTFFTNSSFANGKLRLMNISPQGLLNWTVTSSKNFNGFISELQCSNSGDIFVVGGFLGSIRIGNNAIEHTDTTNTSSSDLEYFVLKISHDGKIIYLRKLPNTVYDIPAISISSQSELMLSIFYDSVFSMDLFTLNELPVSVSNNSGASGILILDPNGFVSNVINTDCNGVDGSSFISVNPLNGNIISLCGFGVAPPFEPSIQPFSFNFLEFDSLGNYLRYREVNIDLFGNTSAGLMNNGNFIFRVDNDSVELQYPCQTVQPGSDKLGYFNYELGPFSFPSKCQVYGGSSINSNSPAIFSDELIGERLFHPGGIFKDFAVYDTSDFSIFAFNPDSVNMAWFKGFNIPIKQMAFNEGHHIVGISLVDSITVIDSLTFTHELGTVESLFLSYYDCEYFNPHAGLKQFGDTIALIAGDLTADWYLNGNLFLTNSESFIVPSQTGLYSAVMYNKFGCQEYSDSISIIVGIEAEKTNGLKVFPNPGHDLINFEFSDSREGILQVYDIQGVLIEAAELNANSITFDVSAWNAGIYIYRIETGDEVLNGKFIVD